MEINININKGQGNNSFLQNSEYSTYYYEVFQRYEVSFPGIKTLSIDLQENHLSRADPKPSEYGSQSNREHYNVVIKINTYPDGKGNIRFPSPKSVFDTIKFRMENEIKHYATVYDRNNPPLGIRLKQLGIDMSSNKDLLANELHGSLGSAKYVLNLDERIWLLSQEDLYQMGRVIIVSGTDKIFSKTEIIEKMQRKLEVANS